MDLLWSCKSVGSTSESRPRPEKFVLPKQVSAILPCIDSHTHVRAARVRARIKSRSCVVESSDCELAARKRPPCITVELRELRCEIAENARMALGPALLFFFRPGEQAFLIGRAEPTGF